MNIFINYQAPTTSYFSPFFLNKRFSIIFLITVSIFTVSCSDETLDIEPDKKSSEILAKSATEDEVKLLELAQGLSPAIKQYNKYYKQENKFLKKYGSFDKENVYGLKLPQYSEDIMLIIPFTSKNLKKNKILIGYYKNGERHYKIFSKKKYKEKKRERIEEGILTHLDFLFELSENKTEGYQGKTVLNKYCDYLPTSEDTSNCTATYTNCQGDKIIVSYGGKMGDCRLGWGSDINADEMEIHMTLDPPAQYPSSPPPDDNDPDTLIADGCDYWDYDCFGSGGGGVESQDNCPPGKTLGKNGLCIDDCNTTIEDFRNVFPNAPETLLSEIATAMNKYAHDFGIDTKEELQHFFAQAAHESTSVVTGQEFGTFEENLNYRISNLGRKDFGKYFNAESNPTLDPNKANPLNFRRSPNSAFVDPVKLANYVYGGRNGNSNPGDGFKYRGRGMIQLTGYDNYKEFTEFYQENYDSSTSFVNNPDLISSDKEIAIISALWFFQEKVLKKLENLSNSSVRDVTFKVNGGYKGLSHRENIFEKAQIYLDCI